MEKLEMSNSNIYYMVYWAQNLNATNHIFLALETAEIISV